jgi:hypothetical protein
MELCDLIYLSPEASMGVTPGGRGIPDNWILIMRGGIEIYVRTPTAADVEILGQKMREAKKRLNKSHPDAGGTAERFREDYAAYQAALKEYEEASDKLLGNKT